MSATSYCLCSCHFWGLLRACYTDHTQFTVAFLNQLLAPVLLTFPSFRLAPHLQPLAFPCARQNHSPPLNFTYVCKLFTVVQLHFPRAQSGCTQNLHPHGEIGRQKKTQRSLVTFLVTAKLLSTHVILEGSMMKRGCTAPVLSCLSSFSQHYLCELHHVSSGTQLRV